MADAPTATTEREGETPVDFPMDRRVQYAGQRPHEAILKLPSGIEPQQATAVLTAIFGSQLTAVPRSHDDASVPVTEEPPVLVQTRSTDQYSLRDDETIVCHFDPSSDPDVAKAKIHGLVAETLAGMGIGAVEVRWEEAA